MELPNQSSQQETAGQSNSTAVTQAPPSQQNGRPTRFTFFDNEEQKTFDHAHRCLETQKNSRKDFPAVFATMGVLPLGLFGLDYIGQSDPGLHYAGCGIVALACLLLLPLIYKRWQACQATTDEDVRAMMKRINPMYDFIHTAPKTETDQPTVAEVLNKQEKASEKCKKDFIKAYSDLAKQNDEAEATLGRTLCMTFLCFAASGILLPGGYGASAYDAGIGTGVLGGFIVLYALYNFARSRTAITPTTMAAKLNVYEQEASNHLSNNKS